MTGILSNQQLLILCESAIAAAQKAGESINSFDRKKLQQVYKHSGSSAASQIVTEVDIRCEQIIRVYLQSLSSKLNIAFIGEESISKYPILAKQRFESPYFWCVDPLDGTLAYTQNRSGYAVSIALIDRSGRPLIGVVYDPLDKATYHAIAGFGSFIGSDVVSHRWRQRDLTPDALTFFSDEGFQSHKSFDVVIEKLESIASAEGLGEVCVVFGSGAVMNAVQTLNYQHACYLKLPKLAEGGGSIWDFAATACLAMQHNAWVSDVYGAPLSLNRKGSLFMNKEGVLFASNKALGYRIISALSSLAMV
ncbi:MAG: inositol monophosphatase [Gammaproteobacteria bacterium]|nr:inositol monophosphatase [Gammaproteobacteria bacterium]